MILGPVAMSTSCKLIAPGLAINGLMSITKTDLYYEMDEDDPENKTIDPKVRLVMVLLCLAVGDRPLGLQFWVAVLCVKYVGLINSIF